MIEHSKSGTPKNGYRVNLSIIKQASSYSDVFDRRGTRGFPSSPIQKHTKVEPEREPSESSVLIGL